MLSVRQRRHDTKYAACSHWGDAGEVVVYAVAANSGMAAAGAAAVAHIVVGVARVFARGAPQSSVQMIDHSAAGSTFIIAKPGVLTNYARVA